MRKWLHGVAINRRRRWVLGICFLLTMGVVAWSAMVARVENEVELILAGVEQRTSRDGEVYFMAKVIVRNLGGKPVKYSGYDKSAPLVRSVSALNGRSCDWVCGTGLGEHTLMPGEEVSASVLVRDEPTMATLYFSTDTEQPEWLVKAVDRLPSKLAESIRERFLDEKWQTVKSAIIQPAQELKIPGELAAK